MGSLRVRHDWVTSLSRIGEGNGNPLQCSCLENPRDGGAWWAAIYGVAQSWTRLKRLSSKGFLGGSVVKNPLANAGDIGDVGSIPGLGRSPGEGKGYPLQHSGLENSMDCIVHGGSKELDTTKRLSVSLVFYFTATTVKKILQHTIHSYSQIWI